MDIVRLKHIYAKKSIFVNIIYSHTLYVPLSKQWGT